MDFGYPTQAVIISYLNARGIEDVVEDNTSFIAQHNQFKYAVVNAFDWASGLGVWLPSATTFNVRGGEYRWGNTVKTYTPGSAVDPTDNDTTYIWMTSSNTIGSAVDGTGWPATDHIKLAEIVVDSDGLITSITDHRGQAFMQRVTPTGYVPIALGSLREVSSNDIPNAAAHGGQLAKDTTPILEFTNGDTDSCLRLNWAAANQDAMVLQIPLPPDIDTASDLTLHCRMASGGTTDKAGFDLDSYFNEGDTKVEDACEQAAAATAYEELTATIAAADVPAGAQTVTIELTPKAHGTDVMYCTAVWLEYTKV